MIGDEAERDVEVLRAVDVSDGKVRLGQKLLNLDADGVSGPSKLFVRRHDMNVGPVGEAATNGTLEGTVRRVRTFGPIQRADIALTGGDTMVEIDAPRDRNLAAGDLVSLEPRRYRIFAGRE